MQREITAFPVVVEPLQPAHVLLEVLYGAKAISMLLVVFFEGVMLELFLEILESLVYARLRFDFLLQLLKVVDISEGCSQLLQTFLIVFRVSYTLYFRFLVVLFAEVCD